MLKLPDPFRTEWFLYSLQESAIIDRLMTKNLKEINDGQFTEGHASLMDAVVKRVRFYNRTNTIALELRMSFLLLTIAGYVKVWNRPRVLLSV